MSFNIAYKDRLACCEKVFGEAPNDVKPTTTFGQLFMIHIELLLIIMDSEKY